MQQVGVKVLPKWGSHTVYSTIPKSREWLTINCVINIAWSTLIGFYILRGERLRDDYIKLCKLGMCGDAKQGMDDKFHVQKIPTVLQKVCSKWDFTN